MSVSPDDYHSEYSVFCMCEVGSVMGEGLYLVTITNSEQQGLQFLWPVFEIVRCFGAAATLLSMAFAEQQ